MPTLLETRTETFTIFKSQTPQLNLSKCEAWWQATKENYLARVPKGRILDVVAEAVSPEEAAKLAGLKKAELVEAAEALLKHKRWLPAVLRSTRADDLNAATHANCIDRLR